MNPNQPQQNSPNPGSANSTPNGQNQPAPRPANQSGTPQGAGSPNPTAPITPPKVPPAQPAPASRPQQGGAVNTPVTPASTPVSSPAPTQTRTTNTQNRSAQSEVQSYQKMAGSYGANKKQTLFAIVIVVFVVLLIVVGAVFLFGGDKGESQNRAAVSETPEEVVPPPPPVVKKDSILRSVDSGRSFETYFEVVSEEELGLVDVLTISFHPEKQNNITVSTYSDGLFVNENEDNTWELVEFPPKRIYSFVIDQANPDNRAFASGVEADNGRIFQTGDAGETWRIVYAEPGNRTQVSALTQDPRSTDIILAGTNRGTLVRSVDAGETWRDISQEIDGSIDDFAHDSTRQSMVYLLSRGDVYHSYDAGLTWANWEEIKKQEIADLKDQARELRREKNTEGSDWLLEKADALSDKNKEEKIPSGIIKIVADPNTSGVLYAGLSRGLYRSTDYGKYWQPLNIIESAEKFPIPSIAINPDNSDEISFVAGNTFYRSINYGATWAVTPLDKTRNASFVSYDPFDTTQIYVGLSAQK